MSTKTRFILSGVISGAVFSVLMTLFDYYNDVPFSFWKFLFYFLLMGLFNGFPQYWAYRKKEKNDSESFNNQK